MKSSKEFAVEVALNYETATLALASELEGSDIEAQKQAFRKWREAVAIMYALTTDDRLHGEAFLAAQGKIRDLDWQFIQTRIEAFVADAEAPSATDPANNNE